MVWQTHVSWTPWNRKASKRTRSSIAEKNCITNRDSAQYGTYFPPSSRQFTVLPSQTHNYFVRFKWGDHPVLLTATDCDWLWSRAAPSPIIHCYNNIPALRKPHVLCKLQKFSLDQLANVSLFFLFFWGSSSQPAWQEPKGQENGESRARPFPFPRAPRSRLVLLNAPLIPLLAPATQAIPAYICMHPFLVLTVLARKIYHRKHTPDVNHHHHKPK